MSPTRAALFVSPPRILSLLAILALIVAVQPVSPASAATTCAITQLEPNLAELMVTQGVGGGNGYARLTRGKETLVKAFMTLPPATVCTVASTSYVKITNAALAVSSGTAANTLFTNLGSKPSLPATIQPESPADPIIVVPASNMVPGTGSAPFDATFAVTVTYDRKVGTTVQTGLTKTFPASPGSTKTIESKTNALRILMIPMGDPGQSYATQYTPTDQAIVQNAVQTLSRIYPLPDGVNDLTIASGGIRYIVDTATVLNLKSISGAYITSGGLTRFCGTSANFNTIKGLLAQSLLNHNSLNPATTADRVVGVVGGNDPTTGARISFGTEDGIGCSDGMASVSSAESWVRLVPDVPAAGRQAAQPSRSGALMAMEVAHTFGLELNAASYHSPNVQADGGADRAYNDASRSRIALDHSVMNFNISTSPWDNTDTLFEPNDYAYLLCKFNSIATTACASPGNIGSSTGVAAGEKYVIAGATDGTPANTTVVEPFYSSDVAEITQDSSSLRLVQLDGAGGVLANVGVPWSPAITQHLPTTPDVFQGGGKETFYAAVPSFSAAAGEVRLVLNGTVLFSTTKIAPPSITSVSAPIPPSGGSTTMKRSQVTPRIPPKPDIVLLADTTGSMGPALQNVRDNAASIMSQVLSAQPQAQFAAASYKDEPAFCASDPYVFRVEQAITSSTSAVQAAITPNADANSGWQTAPGQGCDRPEAQINALYQLAATGVAGFRADSNRVIAWFGDASGHDPSEGHSLSAAIDALKAAGIRVVAINMQAEGSSLDATGQATQIAQATGGVVKSTTDASQVSQAILDGLRDLPATVTPEVNANACDAPLSVTFTPTSQTVPSGTNADFPEVVTVAANTAPGTYTCQVFFKINGRVVTTIQGETAVPDPAFVQNISIQVASAQQQTVTVTAGSADPSRLLLDLVYKCNSYSFIAALAVVPSAATATEATWTTNVDRTNACANAGGGGGTLVPYVSDQWNRTGGTVKTDTATSPKKPTAAIYSPAVGASIGWDATLALRGSGHVAGVELPGSSLTWSIISPSGATTAAGTGNEVDVHAPANGWTQGLWKAVLTVTAEGGTATAEVTWGAQYQFLGFFSPVENPPTVNTGNTGKTFALKWQLRSGGTPISDLSTVASTTYGTIMTCGAPVNDKGLARTSGGSILRFDQANMQFVFNWQTPNQPGLYIFRLTLTDGTTHDACVNLAK